MISQVLFFINISQVMSKEVCNNVVDVFIYGDLKCHILMRAIFVAMCGLTLLEDIDTGTMCNKLFHVKTALYSTSEEQLLIIHTVVLVNCKCFKFDISQVSQTPECLCFCQCLCHPTLLHSYFTNCYDDNI